jgi:hypothetical protein
LRPIQPEEAGPNNTTRVKQKSCVLLALKIKELPKFEGPSLQKVEDLENKSGRCHF